MKKAHGTSSRGIGQTLPSLAYTSENYRVGHLGSHMIFPCQMAINENPLQLHTDLHLYWIYSNHPLHCAKKATF